MTPETEEVTCLHSGRLQLKWATPAHTGKVHTQVVSYLCFVSTERTKQASCCTSGRRELNFALTWIAFVFGSKTWLEKWQLSHGFAVDGAYFLGFSTFLSPKCNCHTVSLWGKAYSLGFGTLEAGILATVVLLPIALSANCFSVSSVKERAGCCQAH